MRMLIAGFGGQGVLFLGKVIATVGLIEEKNVSWLPSYGPEMRGGTANCSICIEEEEIASPIVTTPQTLIVLNKPSFDKFINSTQVNSTIFIDNSLIKISTDDVIYRDKNIIGIPVTKLASDNNLKGLANIILLGYLLQKQKFTSFDILKKSLEKCIPKSKNHLILSNIKALNLGFNY